MPSSRQSSPSSTGLSPADVSSETILKISKEIAIKFIEVGRLTPATFDEGFRLIHRTVTATVRRDE
jgi:hypothetical protein